jgi:hypothetical protein
MTDQLTALPGDRHAAHRHTIARGKGSQSSPKRGSFFGSQFSEITGIAENETSDLAQPPGQPLERKFSRLGLVQSRDQADSDLAFAFEASTPTNRGSYRQDGDQKMQQASNLLRRRKASASTGVKSAIDQLWNVFGPDDKDAGGRVLAASGMNVMVLIIKALYDPSEVQ